MSEESEIVLTEQNIAQLGQALGIPEILADIERLTHVMTDLLLYMNNIEQIALSLAGEPTVTQKVYASQTERGMQLDKKRPSIESLEQLSDVPGLTKKKQGLIVR